MVEAAGYALWLMPSGALATELSGIIGDLAARYGGPRFEPHVTLLGSLTQPEAQLIAAVRESARRIRPVTLRLTELDGQDAYFRCLFVRVEETAGLRYAHLEVRRRLGREDDPPFMPHLSLLYGDYPQNVKDEAIARLGARLGRAFTVSDLHLVATQGPPEDWHIVRTVPLR